MRNFTLPWTPETRRQYCQCAGCKPNSAKARANVALRMMRTQRELRRPFEHCFEMPDADEVVAECIRQAEADPATKALLIRHGYGYWLEPGYLDRMTCREQQPAGS